MESAVGPRVIFNGREYDYFAGTGYLGLQTHPEVVQAAVDALRGYGLSTATSRGSYGEHPLYDRLEQEACAFFGAEKVTHFASGYLGMAVLTQGAADLFDHIFIDSSAHHSLWDAAHATNKPITPFRHRSPGHLADCLRRELYPTHRPLVLSDGVFPVSGEIAPLPDYLSAAAPYRGMVYLDDAHAVGVLGENGRGTAEYFNLPQGDYRTCGTLAKALGGYGGVIWGAAGWVENLERNSRVCEGASPPPVPIAAASAKALEIARSQPGLRKKLRENVALARQLLRAAGWTLEDTPVPIICLEAFKEISLERIASGLFKEGIAVSLARSYPSTPPGGALRIAIFADHTRGQIERLAQTIQGLM
jgi:glycine C-acetyltransferase/8-amino-7-oxononanoate synthase